jgi:hypothetical protein
MKIIFNNVKLPPKEASLQDVCNELNRILGQAWLKVNAPLGRISASTKTCSNTPYHNKLVALVVFYTVGNYDYKAERRSDCHVSLGGDCAFNLYLNGEETTKAFNYFKKLPDIGLITVSLDD